MGIMESAKNVDIEITKDHVFRFMLLVLLPFILGFWLLPHTTFMNGQILGTPNQIRNGSSEYVSFSFSQDMTQSSVPQQVNSAFPLANYLDFPPFTSHEQSTLCIEDKGSYVILPDGSKYSPDFYWDVDFNSGDRLKVGTNSVGCTKIGSDQNNSIRLNLKMILAPSDQFLSSSNVTFVPMVVTYPRMSVDYGLLQGIILIPVAYLFIWYPAAGIWKKIKKGLGEQ